MEYQVLYCQYRALKSVVEFRTGVLGFRALFCIMGVLYYMGKR